ncbi:hypothetical protein ABZY09_45480 [Streptomyces sp. NPDC002928]|uniref:hypothetical protein n=1 Tax=Streptomyces sp. NPDC002928 TaxID=3154440 RepID=UPI0033B3D3A5
MSVRRWGAGAGAVAVLVATGVWVMWPAGVDARLWGEVRPVIEARLVAESQGTGYGETVPALKAKWFCRARALDLEENGDRIRAGVDTFCVEYGVRDGALVECGGSRFPQVVRLKRDTDGDYRVVSREEPPDGEGYAEWEESRFSFFAESEIGTDSGTSAALESAARAHFALPAGTPVKDC